MHRLKLRPNQYKGKLIVFEGTDGAGKTTLIGLTKNYLLRTLQEQEILCVKQPTDLSRKTKLFQKMMYCADHADIDYRAVQLLTMSDRMQHTYEVIEPALRDGKTVLEGTSRHCFLGRDGKFLRLARDFPALDQALKAAVQEKWEA